MKKWKNGKKSLYGEIPNNLTPKVWVSTFPSIDENGKLSLAIMKNSKNGSNFVKNHHTSTVKFQITDP